MKVVIVDREVLPDSVDFPPLKIDKYGWEQYRKLEGEGIAERCWRADIVVALAADINRKTLKKMPLLRLLIVAGKACKTVDQQAVQEQGVELLAFPDAECRDSVNAQDLCNRVSASINHYILTYGQTGVEK